MIKILKLILKITPFLAGAAFVGQQLEKKQKKRFSFKRLLLLLTIIAVVVFGASSISVWKHYDDKFVGQSTGCAVVFGAAVWKNDQPSHALNDRTQAAIELYKQGQVTCLVFSGGASTYGAHEAVVMSKLAREAGIPESAITEDLDGNNTLATMLNLKPQSGYVLVSNDFHLARIGLMAQKLEFENAHLHAAPYLYGRYGKEFYYFGREVLGTILIWFGL